jgi:hypothetical protein
MTKQKFRRYQFVFVDKYKDGKRSINGDFTGIISGSYSDQYGGKGVDTYTIYKLKDDKVVDCCSWYDDWQLTLLLVQDAEHAAELIERYNFESKTAEIVHGFCSTCLA